MATTNTDPSKTPQAPAPEGNNAPAKSVQTQETNPQKDPKTEPEGMMTKEQVAELLQKAREDEKNKVYSKLDAVKGDKEKLEQTLAELEETKKKLEEDRDALREGRATELKSVNEELGQLREQNKKLQESFQVAVDASAKKIREHELKAYKAEKVREAGIKIVELVSGEDEAAIDASIAAAKSREDQIAEELRAEIQKGLANDLPKPISTDGSVGKGPTPVITPQGRQAMARLSKEDYQKARQELLNEAKQKAGYTS